MLLIYMSIKSINLDERTPLIVYKDNHSVIRSICIFVKLEIKEWIKPMLTTHEEIQSSDAVMGVHRCPLEHYRTKERDNPFLF